jgi:UDP-glucose 4-epimerase
MSNSSSRTCVVTGGAGFIGSHLVDRLIEDGWRVIALDNLATGQIDRVHEQAVFVEMDVADGPALQALAREEQPSRWYHLAAQADVRVSVEQPMLDATTNVLGTIGVLEAARVTGAQVVMASTGGAIYGDAERIPTSEENPELPLAPYGAAKLSGEHYVRTFARLYGDAHAIVRYANVYGPRQDLRGEAGVVAIFGGRIASGESATIYGTGEQTRDYVYVGDVVAATIAAGEHSTTPEATPIWNVGTGIETSVIELWNAMQEIAGVELGTTFEDPRPGELDRSSLDANKALRELGVPIATTLHDGLTQTLAWMREQVAT